MQELVSFVKPHRQAILRLALVLSCVLGITFQLMDPPTSSLAGWGVFKAFTIQSNLWIAGWSFYLWIRLLKGKPLSSWMLSIKFMFTTPILLTYIVFALFLSPFMELSYLLSPTNIFLHTATPILALVDALLYDNLQQHRPIVKRLALVMPLLYAVLFVIVYELTNELPVPYFFLNYRLNGWFTVSTTSIGTFWWVLILMGLLVGMARWLYPLLLTSLDDPKRIRNMKLTSIIMIALSLVTLLPHLFY